MDGSQTEGPAPAGPTLPPSLCDAVDVLRGRPLVVSELSGGLTNRNFKVVTPEGAFVVRISAPGGGALSIDRDNEYRNSVIAAGTGVGAPVHAYLPAELVEPGTRLSVGIFGRDVGAVVMAEPLFDPRNEKVRA